MVEQKSFKILRELEEHGPNVFINLSPVLSELFPVDSSPVALKDQYSLYISRLLREMRDKKYLEHKPYSLQPHKWLDQQEIEVAITTEGIEALHAEDLRASVIATNVAMLDNGKLQGKILVQQTYILYVTLFVSFVSVAIAFYTAIQDDSKRKLERKVEVLESHTQALQSQLGSTKRISSPAKEVETSSTKGKR